MTQAGPDTTTPKNDALPTPPEKRGGGLFRTFILLVLLLLAGASWVAHQAYTFLTSPAEKEGREIVFTIAPGATFDRVAWDLKKAGAVTDVDRFRLLARYEKALGTIKAGDFLINTGWTPVQVLRQITRGPAHLVRLSLREGLTWWQTAKAVEAQGFATYDDFVAVIHDPEFLQSHAIPFDNAEGFLFPDTYLLSKPKQLDRDQARAVASLLVRTFWKKNVPVWKRLPARDEAAPEGYGKAVADMGKESIPPLPEAVVKRGEPKKDAGKEGSSTGNAAQGDVFRQGSGTGLLDSEETTESRETQTISDKNGTRQAAASSSFATQTASAKDRTENATDTSIAVATGNTKVDASQGNATKAQAATTDSQPPARRTSYQPEAPDQPSGAQSTDTTAGALAQYGPDPSLKNGFVSPATPAEVSPKALRRLVILASLVERETGVAAERPRVAGVYANRLRIGMLLQCDPTVIYGVGPSFTGSIRRSQLQDASNRYNTYQHPGLPPGPIGSVGMPSLLAALMPEVHKYLYFVATGVGNGHTFSRTIEEHNKAVRVYRSRIRR